MTSSSDDAAPVFNRSAAFRHFASFSGATQSQQHIKPLHDYVAARLVIEGGFSPDDLLPRPPLQVRSTRGRHHLIYTPESTASGEGTILGGLKTKNLDIVATKEGIGPVLAISCKGMTGAFRNLTNRLEETIGECTNIHIGYPMLVFGYLFVARANRLEDGFAANDVAFTAQGEPVEALVRFHAALTEMTGRLGVRNDMSRYEAVGMAMVETQDDIAGELVDRFPPPDSRIAFARFFDTLYRRYDERYVVGAPQLAARTRRLAWSPDSPALAVNALPALDYTARVES